MYILFQPSLLSTIILTIVTIAAIGIQGWSYVSNNQLFYDTLFGPYGITTALIGAPDAFSVVRQALNSDFTYYIALLLGAAIIGVAAYELLEIGTFLAHGKTTFSTITSDISILKEKLARFGVRALSFLAWAVYTVFFVSLFIPFITLALHNGIDAISESQHLSGWGHIGAAAAGLWIGLHVHVIFLRLCFLRPRMFGGWDVELAED
jgi:hypothetical protein